MYCELLARVPVTTTPAPLFEYLTPRGKHSNVLLEFSSSSWLSLSFLILDSKVGSVVTKVCVGFLLCLSPDSDGSPIAL